MSQALDIIVGNTDGEVLTQTERRDLVILADYEQISISHMRYAPGEWGPDPHVHLEHTDAFYLLEGELIFVLGPEEERIQVGAGSFVAATPNVVHSFGNEAEGDARFLNIHAPQAGFVDYLRGRRDGRDVPFDSFDAPDDGGAPLADAIVSGPGEGERMASGNRVVLMKAVLPEFGFGEWAIDGPFNGPEPHRHERQVDSFYVIDGELEMMVEGSTSVAGPGTLAAVPPGVEHTFAHAGDGKARVLNIHSPDGGFADFLRRISD